MGQQQVEIKHFFLGVGTDLCIVLSFIAAVWSLVEYRAKQMVPWEILRKRETAAAETLLLDYVSQNPPKCLLTSFQANHWAVTLVVSVSLLIRLLTVLSTGLFMPQFQDRRHADVPLIATDRFEASALNIAQNSSLPALLPVAFLNYNLALPAGTSDRFAIPTITGSGSLPSMFTQLLKHRGRNATGSDE